jgi:hypothetical protein
MIEYLIEEIQKNISFLRFSSEAKTFFVSTNYKLSQKLLQAIK